MQIRITLLVLVAASASVYADNPSTVLLRIQNYWAVPVEVRLKSDTTSYTLPRKIPEAGSMVRDARSGDTIAFLKAGSVDRQYTVTDEAVQVIRLGPGVKRTLTNDTASTLRAYQIFIDANNPQRLRRKHLFDIPPGRSTHGTFYYGTVLRFADSSGPVEADYIVRSEKQPERHRIEPRTTVSIANLSWRAVNVSLLTQEDPQPKKIRSLAGKSKTPPLSLPVGGVLRFTAGGKPAADDYRIQQGSNQLTQIPWRYDHGDPEWREWVTSSGDYTNFPLQRKIDPNNSSIFGHQFPALAFCLFGYNITKLKPRSLGDDPGTNRLPIFCSLQKARGENHWRIDAEGNGMLLPNYLSIMPSAETTTTVQSFTFKTEAERQNAFGVGIKCPKLGVGFSFDQSSSSATISSKLTRESFDVHSFLWASLNKSEIVLDPDFVKAVLQLRQGTQHDYAAFLDNYGTHYPLATLFGGIRSMQETVKQQGSRLESKVAAQFLIESFSQSQSKSVTTEDLRSKGTVYGATEDDRQQMKPVQVVFAPLDELIRSQLFDGQEVQSIRDSLRTHIDEYITEASKVSAPRHRIFEVRTNAPGDTSTKLFYYDTGDSPPGLYNGFPVDHSGPSRTTLIVTDNEDQVRDNRPVAWFSEHKKTDIVLKIQTVRRIPAFAQNRLVAINEKNGDLLHAGTSESQQPFPFGNISQPDYRKTDSSGVRNHALRLTDALKTRNLLNSIDELANRSPAVKGIQDKGGVLVEALENGILGRVIDDKLRRAEAANLPDYVALLQDLKQIGPLCWQGYSNASGSISMSVREVTHDNRIQIKFPPPPPKIANWVRNNIHSQKLP